MRINLVGAFRRNFPFGTEIAFQRGFERLGEHSVNLIDPSYPNQVWDYSADATIVFKYLESYRSDLEKCKGFKIVYQPDDMRFPHIRQMMVEMRQYCDYALTFDIDCVGMALDCGYLAARRLLVTADNELYHWIPGTHKRFDFCFIGSLSSGPGPHASRSRMIQTLTSAGYAVFVASGMTDIPGIVQIYNSSKIILNHATDVGQSFGHGFGFQCRHFEAGFTFACLLTNVVDNQIDSDPSSMYHFDSEKTLLTVAKALLDDEGSRLRMADAYYEELHDSHMPEHRAQEIVDFIGSLP